MRLEGQIKKLRQLAKLLRKVKQTGTQRKEKTIPKKTIADKTDNTTWRNKSKDIGEKGRLKKYRDRVKQYI